MATPVLLDSSVLFPNVMRDVLLTLAEHGLYEPKWSAEILNEVKENVTAKRGVPVEAIDRTFALMAEVFEYALVAGWERYVDDLDLPDPDDRHVLAAAIASGAEIITTSNVRDFPALEVEQYEISVMTADAFLQRLIEIDPEATFEALHTLVARYRRPPVTREALLGRLRKAGARQFAERLAEEGFGDRG